MSADTHIDTDDTLDGKLQTKLLGFIQFWRYQLGVNISTQEVNHWLSAVQGLLDQGSVPEHQQLKTMLRSMLCRNIDQWQAFDALFTSYWQQPLPKAEKQNADAPPSGGNAAGLAQQGGYRQEDLEENTGVGASPGDTLVYHDFRFLFAAKAMREAERLIDPLAAQFRLQAARRYHYSGHGSRLSLAQTLRAAVRQGGEPMRWRYQSKRRRQPPIIALLDVSQSMEVYSYFFFRLLRALSRRLPKVHCFAFDTRLVDLSEVMRLPNGPELRRRLSAISNVWHGGTRIADCLQIFLNEQDALLTRNARVVIFSDAHDSCDVEQLDEALSALYHRCQYSYWLDPLMQRQNQIRIPDWQQQRYDCITKHCKHRMPAHSVRALRQWIRCLARSE